MAINKVIYGNRTLIDLTGDTVSPDKLAQGITAHDKSGAIITGTNTFDSNTSDATAKVSEILEGKTAYVAGTKITGTMPYRGTVVEKILKVSDEITISQGYHDGSGNVSIDEKEQAKIIPQKFGEIKIFSDKQLTPQEMLKEVLQLKEHDRGQKHGSI